MLVAVGFAATLSAQSQNYWAGGSSLNWSDSANWDPSGVPDSSSTAWFEDIFHTGYTNAAGLVNNIVSTSSSVGSVFYSTWCEAPSSSSAPAPYYHFDTTLIPTGNTLTLGGLGASVTTLAVGDVPSQGSGSYRGPVSFPYAGYTNYTTMIGGGSLVVSDPAGVISVAGGLKSTLDLSGLSTFTANVGKIVVGASSDNSTTISGATDSLFLARTNSLNTAANLSAPGILMAANPNRTAGGIILLGQANSVNTDGLVVGGRRGGSGTLLAFAGAYSNTPAMGHFTLRGSDGNTAVSVFSVGDVGAEPNDYNAYPYSSTSTSMADFSGGVVDILADSIYIGRSTPSTTTNNNTSTATGIMIVENGTVTATNVYLANKVTATNATAGQGTLVLRSNATMNVVKDLSLCFRTNGGAFISFAQLYVSNSAVLNVGGNISCTNTGSWTPASINLAGNPVINMTGGGTVNVPILAGAGYFTNASSILVTNALVITNIGNPLVASTLHVGNNLVLSNGFALGFKLGVDNTVGGGINDYLDVANNITFSTNRLNLTFGAPLVVGNYTLISYGGTQTGTVTWTNTSRSAVSLVQGSGSVGLNVASWVPANLTWAGTNGVTGAWDSSVTNWNANTDKFFPYDNVVFDDTGMATNVSITGITNTPGSLTFNNSTKKYTVTQASSGAIGGFTSLTKNGTGTLVMGGGGANNYFTGPVNLNQGILQMAAFNTGVLGVNASTSPINIASGAMLDLNGQSVGSLGSYGRAVNMAGTGVGGMGAIAHNGTSGNLSLTTRDITLTGDTTVGISNNLTMTLGGVVAPYQSSLHLNGHTLTTASASGLGIVRLSQFTITDSGSINVTTPYLGLNSVILDGPGTINLGSKYLNFYNPVTVGYVAKAISVSGGAISAAGTSAAMLPLLSPISIASGTTLSITNGQPILASGVISGANGSLIKYGNSNLVMSAANTYSGTTEVTAGNLVLTNGGSLASALVQVDPVAAFDVSPLAGGYLIPAGQNLAVSGTVIGNVTVGAGATLSSFGTNAGTVTVSANGTVSPGSALVQGTLTTTSNLTFNGGTAVIKLNSTTTPGAGINDLIQVAGDLTFNATTTVRISPVAALSGQPYTLFTYSGTLTGAGNIVLVSDSPRYTFTLDTISIPGSVLVTKSGSGGNLLWTGADAVNPTLWNVGTTANWLNGANPDMFFQGDSVTFDDSGLTNLVTVVNAIRPAGMTNNASGSYILNGTGSLLVGTLAANSGTTVFANTNAATLFNGDGILFNGGAVTFNQPVDSTLQAKLAGGGGSLNKAGVNKLTISSANALNMYAPVNVNAGTLQAGSSNVLGAGAVTIGSGGTLDINGQVLNTATVHAAGVGADGQGAINNRGAKQTNAISSLTLDGDTTLGAASNRWDLIPSGILQGNNHNLTKVGPADVWLQSGASSGMGNIDATGGRLVFGGVGNDLGDATVSILTVHTNATFGLAGGIQGGTKPVVVQAGGSLYATNSGNRFDGQVTLTNGVVLMEPNATVNFGGNITGPGTLNVKGTSAGLFGTVTLEGHNTYSGGTVVNDGELIISNSFSLPSNTNVTLSSRVPANQSGHPIISLASNVVSPVGVLLDMQTVGSAGAAQATLDGNGATWSGPIRLTGNSPNCTGRFSASGTNGLTILGAVDGTGFTGGGVVAIAGDACDTTTMQGVGVRFASPLIFSGNLQQTVFGGSLGSPQMPKLFLGASTNYWTNMLFYRGVIQLGANNALPLTPITVGHGFDGDHRFILDLNGYNQTLVSFADTFNNNDPVWFGNSSSNADSVLTFAISGTNTIGPFIVDAFDTNAPIQHKTSLAVTAGRLRLIQQGLNYYYTFNTNYIFPPSGPLANTYTGPTTVSGGTLEVDAINLGPSAVTVSSGGTLAGSNGVFMGTVTIGPGGTLSPGTSIGTLYVSNNLVLGGNCLMEVNLSTGVNDRVLGMTSLTYGGTLVLTNIGAQAYTNGTVIKLFDAATYVAGAVTIQPSSPGPGLMWDASQLPVNGTLHVTTVVTPTLASAARRSDGNISFQIGGTVGQGYSVRASTNVTLPLSSWTVIQSGSLPSASYLFNDLSATNYPNRFYLISSP
jgi:autotransporter-associated beta strand protein